MFRHHMHTEGDQDRVIDPLKLELQLFVNHHVGAVN